MIRSAQYLGDRTFTVADTEPVPPGPGEVRLAVSDPTAVRAAAEKLRATV